MDVGEIRLFAFNYAPAGWLPCDGRLLPISENEVLYQLIGTTYGGDGESTFALPDLRGRVPVHVGTHPEWTVGLGDTGGQIDVTLTPANMPLHTHPIMGRDGKRTQASPAGAVLVPGDIYGPVGETSGFLAPSTISPWPGPAQPHANLQPYLALHYCIALFGRFPPPT